MVSNSAPIFENGLSPFCWVFQTLFPHFMRHVLLKPLNKDLTVSSETVPIRSCAYKQTQRVQKIVCGTDA